MWELTQGSRSQGQGQQAEALRRERPSMGTELTIVLTCTLLTDANTSVTHRYVLVYCAVYCAVEGYSECDKKVNDAVGG